MDDYRCGMARGRGSVVAIGLALVALTGCIGATTRDDFDEEVRARGGGLTSTFVDDSLAAIAAEYDVADWRTLSALSLVIQPGDRLVTATVRDPARLDFVDTKVVVDAEVRSTTPLQDAGDLPLDAITFPLGSVAIVPVEPLATAALDAFGEEGGFVQSMAASLTAGEVTIRVDLESARRTATATFDAEGTLVGLD
ncbi:MAG: hypothetical protein ACR2O6_09670 [Ilumatobacteraceae bacterium]